MLYNVKNHVYPTTVEETVSFLEQKNSRILAGGTGLTLINDSSIETLVDIQRLDLSYINVDDHFSIGALTSSYDIAFHESLPQSLRECARKIGDIPLLHGVTIGGNIAEIYPWSDLPSILWVLNATIKFYDSEKKEIIELEADTYFPLANERNFSTRKALILEIQVPKHNNNSYSQFQKFIYTRIEKSHANLASFFQWAADGTIEDVRLCASALTNKPRRLENIEQLINGQIIDEALINTCVKQLQETIKVVPSYKSSKEYRQHILGVYLKRTMSNCLKTSKST